MSEPFNKLYNIIQDFAGNANIYLYPNIGESNPLLLGSQGDVPPMDSIAAFKRMYELPSIIFHDQEPINFTTYKRTWEFLNWDFNMMEGNNILVNSELNSAEKDALLALTGWKDVYFFSNGFLALEWYRFYRYINIDDTWLLPNKKFSCYNRLIDGRKHRTEIGNLLESFPHNDIILSLGDLKINTYPYNDDNRAYEIEFADFKDSFCHVVTERLFEPRIHLTEKVFKPIICCRPFVLASSPGSLAYLRRYGFKTFDKYWDESYDAIIDPVQRIEKIKEVLIKLNSMSIDEMRAMLLDMQEILQFNRNHFYGKFADLILEELYRNLTTAMDGIHKPGTIEKIAASLSQDEKDVIMNNDIVGTFAEFPFYGLQDITVPSIEPEWRKFLLFSSKFAIKFLFETYEKVKGITP